MTSVGKLLLEKEILLESGTNELEILVFDVSTYKFGINVAKVREVLPLREITALPQAHASVRGVFRLRDQVVPCVSLYDHLGLSPRAENPETTLILADFNNQQTAFLVDSVERIYRLSWQHILALPPLEALAQVPVTALARSNERLIVMLDFEMIVDQVTGDCLRAGVIANPHQLDRASLRIVLADDSPTVRASIARTLSASGYSNLHTFENGAAAWNWLERRLQETGGKQTIADLVITDVEMPQVDGLHLTRRIKEHPQLQQLPVLLYSSIITPDNHKKGKAVGADAQVAKPELTRVVELADQLIMRAKGQAGAAAQAAATGKTPAAGEEPATAPAAGKSAAGNTAAANAPTPPPNAPAVADAPAAAKSACPASYLARQAPSAGAALAAADVTDALARIAEAAQASSASATPASVTDAQLWMIYRDELTDLLTSLKACLDRLETSAQDAEARHQLQRVLHTIKSASMVVPVNEIARLTHLLESALESAGPGSGALPRQELAEFAELLGKVAAGELAPPRLADEALALEAGLMRNIVGQSA